MIRRRFITGLSEVRVGGSYHRFIRMIQALAAAGFEVSVVTTSPACIHDARVHWKHVGGVVPDSLKTWAFLMTYPFRMMAAMLFKGGREFIAYGPVYAALLFPVRLCKTCRIYCMVRGMLSSEYRYQGRGGALKSLVTLFERMGFRVSHRIIVVSKTLEKEIRQRAGIPTEKFTHLPNEIPDLAGVTIDKPFGRALWEEKLTVGGLRLFAGGVITAIKNFETLLAALKDLDFDFHLCIAGSPANRQDRAYFRELESLTKRLGLKERVSWLGWLPRERLLGVLAASHLLVAPSRHEGMSNILLEALALGVPCVAMKTPESLELLRSEILLFESTEGLSKIIKKFQGNALFRLKVQSESYQARRYWTFNWDEKLVEALT